MNVWDEKGGGGAVKTLKWIHSKIILKQIGPIYLNYSCLNPELVWE